MSELTKLDTLVVCLNCDRMVPIFRNGILHKHTDDNKRQCEGSGGIEWAYARPHRKADQ